MAKFTAYGYRKGPSRQTLLNMISKANFKLENKTKIEKAFQGCGVAANGHIVPTKDLNGHLKQYLITLRKKIVMKQDLWRRIADSRDRFGNYRWKSAHVA